MHLSDIPVLGNDSFMMGLGLWNYHPLVSYITEGIVLLVGLFIYMKATKGISLIGKYGMVSFVTALFVLNAMFTFVQLQSDSRFVAALGLILYIVITLVGFWLDKKRI